MRRIVPGRLSTYEKDMHISILYDVFSKGEGVMAFCAEALISQVTFFRWLKIHAEFAEAYQVMLNCAGRQWEAYPLDPNKSIDFRYWSLVMRNRFGYGKSSFKLGGAKTGKDLMQAAKEHLDENKISIKDYSAIVDSAKAQVAIDTGTIEAIQDSKLHITIERKNHDNLDMLSDFDIAILRKDGGLTPKDISTLKKKGRI